MRQVLFDPPDDGLLVWAENLDGWTAEELDWADPTTEDAPSPDVVARFLRSLALLGDLQCSAGLVFSRPGGGDLDPAVHPDYDDAVLQVVRAEQRLHGLPVVTGVDFGHSDPMWTVPKGVRLRVDPEARQLVFLEAGVV